MNIYKADGDTQVVLMRNISNSEDAIDPAEELWVKSKDVKATNNSKPLDELIEKYESYEDAIESVYSVATNNPIIRTMAKDMKNLAVKWICEFIKDLKGLRDL